MAAPVPTRDLDLEAVLGEAERELAHALAELGALRTASQAHGEELAALRRAAAARQAEIETARRRLADIERRATEETEQAEAGGRTPGNAGRPGWRRRGPAWPRRPRRNARPPPVARRPANAPTGPMPSARPPMSGPSRRAPPRRLFRPDSMDSRRAWRRKSRVASRGPRDGPAAVVSMRTCRSIRRCGRPRRRRSPRPPAPTSSPATPSRRSPRNAARSWSRNGPPGRSPPTTPANVGSARRWPPPAAGSWTSAVQRDVTGAARRLLGRAAWLPDLASCLAIQAALARRMDRGDPGRRARSSASSGSPSGRAESILDRRAEATRLAGELETHEAEAGEGTGHRRAAGGRGQGGRRCRRDRARGRESRSRRAAGRRGGRAPRRPAARDGRSASTPGTTPRPSDSRADLERARIAAGRAAEARRPMRTRTPERRSTGRRWRPGRLARPSSGHAAIGWPRNSRASDSARRDAENRRARAEASTVIAEERIARADREVLALGERERAAAAERDALRAEIATTAAAREPAPDRR